MQTTQASIRVVIADDQELLRELLKLVLVNKGFTVTGTAKHGKELLAVVAETVPDVVLTDVCMPQMDGIAATRELSRQYPEVAVVGLTQFDEEHCVVEMLKAGAKGFLFKDESLEELYEALVAVYEGQTYYCKKVPMRLLRRIIREEAGSFRVSRGSFNALELDVIRLLCQDFNSKEMAGQLHRSKDTIDKYRQRIMEKLGVRGVAGVVLFAVKEGIYREG